MRNQLVPMSEVRPEDAKAIGALFRKAFVSHAESVKYLAGIGEKLKAVKSGLDHGSWMLWLKEHQEVLGFDDRTARRLMMASAKLDVTSNMGTLKDDEAARISRQVWGNAPEPKTEIEEHSKEYRQIMRMYEWTQQHPAWTVNSSMSRVEASEIQPQLYLIKEWIVSLERAITALPGSNGRVIENVTRG